MLDVHSDQVGQASSAGTLTGEGALLASLSSRRTGKMTDIVATIQAEQDRIIRSDMNRAWWCRAAPAPARRPWRSIAPPTCCTRTGARWNVPACWLLAPARRSCTTSISATLLGRDRRGLTHHQRSDSRHHRHGGRLPLCSQAQGDRRMTSVVANAIAARVRVPAALPTVTH